MNETDTGAVAGADGGRDSNAADGGMTGTATEGSSTYVVTGAFTVSVNVKFYADI